MDETNENKTVGKSTGGNKTPGFSNKYIEGKEKKRKKEIYGVNKTLKRSISQSQW